MIRIGKLLVFAIVTLSLTPTSFPQFASSQFLYLSDQRIVVLELVDAQSAILNYVNLSDSFEMLYPFSLVLLDSLGKPHRGQVFTAEEAKGDEDRFTASRLVKPGEFAGFEVKGDFRMEGKPQRVVFLVSGRITALEFVRKRDFEVLVARIGELDLAFPNRKLALERAGFRRGYGQMHFSGSQEAVDLEPYFADTSVLPPVALETPQPRLPSSEKNRADPVVVRISAGISRSGGLVNVEVVEGVDAALDRLALETVRNSWHFLPAISEAKVAESEVKLNVVFRRD